MRPWRHATRVSRAAERRRQVQQRAPARNAASRGASPACPPPAAVTGLPTLLLFKDGKPVDRIEGVISAPDLTSRLEYWLRQGS